MKNFINGENVHLINPDIENQNEINQNSHNIWSPFWLTLKSSMGITVLTLPYFSFHTGNIFFNGVTLAVLSLLNYYSSIRYFSSADLMEYSGGSLRHLANLIYGIINLWQQQLQSLGKFGIILNEISLFSQSYTAIILFMQAFSTSLQNFLCSELMIQQSCISFKYFLFIPYVIIIIQTLVTKKIIHFTTIGFCTGSFILMLLIFEGIFSVKIISTNHFAPLPNTFLWINYLYMYSAGLFAVECSVGQLSYRSDFSNKNIYMKGMTIAYLVVLFCYLMISILVPYAFGSSINELSFLSFENGYKLLTYAGYCYIFSLSIWVPVILFPYYYIFEETEHYHQLSKKQKQTQMMGLKIGMISIALILSFCGNSVANFLSIFTGLFCPFSMFAVPILFYHKAYWIKCKTINKFIIIDIVVVVITITLGFIAAAFAVQEWIATQFNCQRI